MNFIGAVDLQFELLLLGIRSPLLTSVFKAVTELGEISVVIALGIVAGIILWRSAPYRAYVTGLATAVLGAGATTYILKDLIGRTRPDGLFPAIVETSGSFPSGHATLSMALYGFTAYALCKMFPAKAFPITLAAVLLIGAIGFSRLYLGVHFPSDVLAGYAVGGLWLLLGIRAVRALHSTGPAGHSDRFQ